MNRDQAKQVLPLITAYAEGKTIQQRKFNGWQDIDQLDFFTYSIENFRIKPEPKVFYINKYSGSPYWGRPCSSAEEAAKLATLNATEIAIKFIEEL